MNELDEFLMRSFGFPKEMLMKRLLMKTTEIQEKLRILFGSELMLMEDLDIP